MSSGNIHIHSMTGFANAAAECGSKRINLDLRAVNHRFLDIQIRMPDDLRYLESGIREKISSHIARGKVECKIQIQDAENGSQSLELNSRFGGQLAEINKDLRKHHDLAKLGVADILRFPGVLASQRENTKNCKKHYRTDRKSVKRLYCRTQAGREKIRRAPAATPRGYGRNHRCIERTLSYPVGNT